MRRDQEEANGSTHRSMEHGLYVEQVSSVLLVSSSSPILCFPFLLVFNFNLCCLRLALFRGEVR